MVGFDEARKVKKAESSFNRMWIIISVLVQIELDVFMSTFFIAWKMKSYKSRQGAVKTLRFWHTNENRICIGYVHKRSFRFSLD